LGGDPPTTIFPQASPETGILDFGLGGSLGALTLPGGRRRSAAPRTPG
jgi:hypothetical protein